jgi:hypothetical protein
MTCSSVCIAADEYAEQASFYRESEHTARKQHQCCECHRPIEKGTRYFKATGVWEGEWNTYTQCLPCMEIQRTFSCGGSWLYEGLWEMWDEADGFSTLSVYDKCFQQLSLPARQFLVDRWWKWKERSNG